MLTVTQRQFDAFAPAAQERFRHRLLDFVHAHTEGRLAPDAMIRHVDAAAAEAGRLGLTIEASVVRYVLLTLEWGLGLRLAAALPQRPLLLKRADEGADPEWIGRLFDLLSGGAGLARADPPDPDALAGARDLLAGLQEGAGHAR